MAPEKRELYEHMAREENAKRLAGMKRCAHVAAMSYVPFHLGFPLQRIVHSDIRHSKCLNQEQQHHSQQHHTLKHL